MSAESEYREAANRVAETQTRLGALPKGDPAREPLKRELAELHAGLGRLKEAIKAENTRKNFAGLGNTPLYLACVEKLNGSVVAELEVRALEIQTEREQAANARRAAKAATTPAPPPAPSVVPTKRGEVEVVVLRPNGGSPR